MADLGPRPHSASIEPPGPHLSTPGRPSPFSARKEPEIDDPSVQRVRIVLALGVVNLILAGAAVLIASVPVVH